MFELNDSDKLIKRDFIRFLKDKDKLIEYKLYFLKYHREYANEFLLHLSLLKIEHVSHYDYKFDSLIYLYKYLRNFFKLLQISFSLDRTSNMSLWFSLMDESEF